MKIKTEEHKLNINNLINHTVISAIYQVREKEINRLQEQIDELRKTDWVEFLAKGISIGGAPSPLSKKMGEKGWIYIEYDPAKPSWRITTFNNCERYVAVSEVQDMLNSKD